MAVDLGGTNFRVCSVHLNGDTTFEIQQEKVAIEPEMMAAKTYKELFAHMAKQIELFLKKHHNDHFEEAVRRRKTMSASEGFREEHVFRLGFTFSFPVEQFGINRGNLIRWTKGYDIKDAVGKDVCALLQTEIDLLHLPVKVAALVNDTVGTLMARSYTSPGKTGTLLGAIFGTGTNGAYVEKLDKITKLQKMNTTDYDKSTGEMIVNTEWGSFDNTMIVLPTTPYDDQLDKVSVNPGIQMFEKRVSGMFLGEILRLSILSLINNSEIDFLKEEKSKGETTSSAINEKTYPKLHKKHTIDASFLSISQADASDDLSKIKEAFRSVVDIGTLSTEDARAIKLIAAAIAKRSARLSAVAIGAIVIATGRLEQDKPTPAITSETKAKEQVDKDSEAASEDEIIDIGVDGSLVEKYPGFVDYIREALKEIPEIGPSGEKKIRIGQAEDGSGVGAALIALVARKVERPLDLPIESFDRGASLPAVE